MRWQENQMGRHKKYNSEEEKKEAQRRWSMDYYKKNRAVLQAKARERYRKKRQMELKEKQIKELCGE